MDETETNTGAEDRKRRAQAPKERSGGSLRLPVRPKVPNAHSVGYLGGRQGEVSGAF